MNEIDRVEDRAIAKARDRYTMEQVVEWVDKNSFIIPMQDSPSQETLVRGIEESEWQAFKKEMGL